MEINNRVLQGYENMRLVHYTNAEALPNRIAYEDLPKRDVVGTLKAAYYENGKLMQLYSTNENHV